MISVKEIADRFGLSEKDTRKVFIAYGNKVSYQFITYTNQGYSVHEDVLTEINDADREFNKMVVPLSEIMKRVKDSIPFAKGPKLYFLFNLGKLVYIGMSHSLAARIGNHVEKKVFDKAAVFDVKASRLPLVEKVNIWYHNPPLNCDALTQELYFREVLKQGVWQ